MYSKKEQYEDFSVTTAVRCSVSMVRTCRKFSMAVSEWMILSILTSANHHFSPDSVEATAR